MTCHYRHCTNEVPGRKWYCCPSHHWKEKQARHDENKSCLGPVRKRTPDFIYLRTGFQGYNRKGKAYGPTYTLVAATRENILKHFRTGDNILRFGDGKQLHGRDLAQHLNKLNSQALP